MQLTRRTLLAAAPLAWSRLRAADPKTYPVEVATFPYATRGGGDLLLDLYLPKGVDGPLPVIVFLHGGGWSGGTRTTGPDFKRFFAQDGFAIASIEYRLTPAVRFPSNAEDVKTAIRWLRANAAAHGLGQRIGIWGTSAGGHLSGIAGLTPRGVFEGDGMSGISSSVECVLDAYGPSMFSLMDKQTDEEKATLQPQAPALASAPPMVAGVVVGGGAPRAGAAKGGPRGPLRHDPPTSAESNLLGAPIQSVPDLVRAASPLTYVKSGAPPFLLMHGLADDSVPHHQSILLYEALAAAGNEATLRLVDGLPHTFFNRTNLDELAGPFRMDVRDHPAGGAESKREERAGVFDVARDFFTKHLR
jgi:acetyl esterase/lipase